MHRCGHQQTPTQPMRPYYVHLHSMGYQASHGMLLVYPPVPRYVRPAPQYLSKLSLLTPHAREDQALSGYSRDAQSNALTTPIRCDSCLRHASVTNTADLQPSRHHQYRQRSTYRSALLSCDVFTLVSGLSYIGFHGASQRLIKVVDQIFGILKAYG